jgi:hypothetical protein
MRPFLARFSEPVGSVHTPSWVDFITIMPVFKFSVHTAVGDQQHADDRESADAVHCGSSISMGYSQAASVCGR